MPSNSYPILCTAVKANFSLFASLLPDAATLIDFGRRRSFRRVRNAQSHDPDETTRSLVGC